MISVVILTKNEEENISDCIKSLSWCDEVIVVDDNSEDRTIEIAKKLNAKVFTHAVNDDFSTQRNFGLEKAQNGWILFVDSDERVSEALAFEISNVISNWTNGKENEYKGFYIRRVDFIWDKELSHGESGVKFLRLAKKNEGLWEGKVHEGWKIKGKIGLLKNSIIHYPHQTVAEFLKEINFYTTIRAKELYKKRAHSNFISILMYPLGKFILNYFLRRGILDGVAGLVIAITMSFHSFLVRGKLWLLYRKHE